MNQHYYLIYYLYNFICDCLSLVSTPGTVTSKCMHGLRLLRPTYTMQLFMQLVARNQLHATSFYATSNNMKYTG